MVRGRVVGTAPGIRWVRTQDGDRRAEVPPADRSRPGDLVEVEAEGGAARVAWTAAAEWPPSGSEVARMPRARLDNLAARGRALAAVRAYLAGERFLEIEAPVRIRAPALEVHVEAIACDGGYLATSPEYQLKRLLAAGLERVFSLGKCLRGGERGPQHNPEFSLLEWYRAWGGWRDVLADTESVVHAIALAASGSAEVERGGRQIDLSPPWPRLTVKEAMARFAGVEIDGDESSDELRGRLRAAGVDVGQACAWDDLFFTGFLARVEPKLAEMATPVVLIDWPAPLGALARRTPDDPRVVERFEVYAGGLELCNGFGELVDPIEQRARFEDDRAGRAERGKPVHAIDERLLAALAEGIPPSAGNALGIDRVLMLVTGATEIRDVLAFADEEL